VWVFDLAKAALACRFASHYSTARDSTAQRAACISAAASLPSQAEHISASTNSNSYAC
jgi:hypothetical protein